jgi:threonine synthase
MTAAFIDPISGETFPLDQPRWCAPNGRPLLITPLPGITRADIDQTTRSLWRYRHAFPITTSAPITLGEGCTPLLSRHVHGVNVQVKCEWMMPSGSFKDRGASVMLSFLRDQGIHRVLEDSSGNGGSAIATYAATGGMEALILAPDSTSPAKTIQMQAMGALVERVPGSRQDTADAALRRAEQIFYASHNWHPFFLQGTKTLAYELWEDLGFTAPDNIIVPCGAGSNVLGCGIGFAELLRAGEIAALPRIFAAQPEHCAPIAAAFFAGNEAAAEHIAIRPTIAEGTAIAKPVRLHEVIGVLRETNGGAVTLTEAEIAASTLTLAHMGLYVEPTCAQVAGALGKLLQSGAISANQTTVLVLTGTALKATPIIASLLGVAI